MIIKSKVLEFYLGGEPRKYAFGAVSYGALREHAKVDVFDSKQNTGEQRVAVAKQVKKIKTAIQENSYTPTVFTLGTREVHRDSFEVNDKGILELEVDSSDPLPILDGGCRSAAFESIRGESPAFRDRVDNTMIPFLLILDGDPRRDFIALQEGMPVSRDLLLSLRISSGLLDEKVGPYYNIAVEVAKLLHGDKESAFFRSIQFDNKNKSKLPLSISTLCSKGAKDNAFSLFGCGKLAVAYNKDAEFFSSCITKVYNYLNDNTELLEIGRLLCPVPDGSKSGNSLLIALGNMLAFSLITRQRDTITDLDLEKIAESAEATLDVGEQGNTSREAKSTLLNDFCNDYFSELKNLEDIEIGFHQGVPKALIKILSASTFNVDKLPANSSAKRGRPKRSTSGITDAANVVIMEDDLDLGDDEVIELNEEIINDEVDDDWIEEDEEAKVNTEKLLVANAEETE